MNQKSNRLCLIKAIRDWFKPPFAIAFSASKAHQGLGEHMLSAGRESSPPQGMQAARMRVTETTRSCFYGYPQNCFQFRCRTTYIETNSN
jgi:hypothetical protein